MAEIDKARLIELAEAKLDDAKLLLNAGRADNAYYLAGYAVELMLKAIVAKRFRTDTCPIEPSPLRFSFTIFGS